MISKSSASQSNSANFERILRQNPQRKTYQIVIAVLVLGMLFWSSTSMRQDSVPTLNVAYEIFAGITRPDWSFLFNLTSKGVPYLLFETICIAFLGTIVGSIIALPLAFLSATKTVPLWLAWFFRFVVMAIRTIPSLVYALMFIRVTGPGPFAGVMTMGVVSVGMVTKLMIDAIEDIDLRVLESLAACGCTKFEQIRYGVIPQLTANFMSIVIYRFDMNLRDASVLGLVGAGGIGAPLIFAMNSYRWHEVGSLLLGLVILVLCIETFSNRIRQRLARGY